MAKKGPLKKVAENVKQTKEISGSIKRIQAQTGVERTNATVELLTKHQENLSLTQLELIDSLLGDNRQTKRVKENREIIQGLKEQAAIQQQLLEEKKAEKKEKKKEVKQVKKQERGERLKEATSSGARKVAESASSLARTAVGGDPILNLALDVVGAGAKGVGLIGKGISGVTSALGSGVGAIADLFSTDEVDPEEVKERLKKKEEPQAGGQRGEGFDELLDINKIQLEKLESIDSTLKKDPLDEAEKKVESQIKVERKKKKKDEKEDESAFDKLGPLFMAGFAGIGSLLGTILNPLGAIPVALAGIGTAIGTGLARMAPIIGRNIRGILGVGAAGVIGFKVGQKLNEEFELDKKIVDFLSPSQDEAENKFNVEKLKEKGIVKDDGLFGFGKQEVDRDALRKLVENPDESDVFTENVLQAKSLLSKQADLSDDDRKFVGDLIRSTVERDFGRLFESKLARIQGDRPEATPQMKSQAFEQTVSGLAGLLEVKPDKVKKVVGSNPFGLSFNVKPQEGDAERGLGRSALRAEQAAEASRPKEPAGQAGGNVVINNQGGGSQGASQSGSPESISPAMPHNKKSTAASLQSDVD